MSGGEILVDPMRVGSRGRDLGRPPSSSPVFLHLDARLTDTGFQLCYSNPLNVRVLTASMVWGRVNIPCVSILTVTDQI